MAAYMEPTLNQVIPIYISLLLIFGGGTFAVLKLGTHLNADRSVVGRGVGASESGAATQTRSPGADSKDASKTLRENLRHPLSVLLLQVIVILLTARVIGTLFRKLGQPTVVGEMVAGILLGPSLLGLLSPGAMTFLFPPTSLETLQLLSQVGIILFMFIVGMELNLQHLRRKAHAAVLVSHVSIVVPFFLGAAFSLLLYRSYVPDGISFTSFSLFIAVAMSITAFPVLASIIKERGLSKSYLGNMAIACAAVDDATAWCLLAVVVASVKAEGLGGAAMTVVLMLLFVGVMLFLLKPRAERLVKEGAEEETWGRGLVATVLGFVFFSALLTEIIGIHALFGAMLAGVVMPSHAGLRLFLTRQLETITKTFLMPLFFAFTGLRTQIGLLDDWSSWLVCAGVIAVAIAGKVGGSALAAGWAGMGRRDSLSLGVLMNTRGLMELIVLNIGYDLGILSPEIFSMLVFMAIATTFMTGPLLSLLDSRKAREAVAAPGV